MWATSRGLTCVHRPLPGLRKSGIPEGTEIPAPVRTAAGWLARSSSARRRASATAAHALQGPPCKQKPPVCGGVGKAKVRLPPPGKLGAAQRLAAEVGKASANQLKLLRRQGKHHADQRKRPLGRRPAALSQLFRPRWWW